MDENRILCDSACMVISKCFVESEFHTFEPKLFFWGGQNMSHVQNFYKHFCNTTDLCSEDAIFCKLIIKNHFYTYLAFLFSQKL